MDFILTKRNSIDNRNESQINSDDSITKFYFSDELNVYSSDRKIKNIIKINTTCNDNSHEINFNGNIKTISDSDIKRIIIANGYTVPEHFNKSEYSDLQKVMYKPQKTCILS